MPTDEYYRELDQLSKLHKDAIERLACAGVLDRNAFEEYRNAAAAFVKTSQSHSLVSKRALQLINSAITYCQCNAEYSSDQVFIDDFGRYMAHVFYCIIGDEDLDDRQAGIPRII